MKTPMGGYFDRIVDFTRELIRYKSVEGEASAEYPFGKECADCLCHFLSVAEGLGFEVHNYDNYIGEVVFGEGEDFAILCHLDVVPAGDGWKYGPFDAELNDDVSAGGTEGMKIWGRGALDDKAPAAVILYALLALRDRGIVPNRRFRLILGCNEESGWRCVEHFNRVSSMPSEGFTPDADFPVIYAEGGILHLEVDFPLSDCGVVSLFAGDAINMVPAYAEAELSCPISGVRAGTLPSGAILEIDGGRICARGKSAHGSTPECGINALEALLFALIEISPDAATAYSILFEKKLNISHLEDSTKRLSLSPDLARYSSGVLTVSVDVRYPATMTLSDVEAELMRCTREYRVIRHTAPLYNDPNGELISLLCGVYSDFTGESAEPHAIGGGTYARALGCGCAFGPELPGMEATVHQPNEFITLEHIRLLSDIYYTALERLSF